MPRRSDFRWERSQAIGNLGDSNVGERCLGLWCSTPQAGIPNIATRCCGSSTFQVKQHPNEHPLRSDIGLAELLVPRRERCSVGRPVKASVISAARKREKVRAVSEVMAFRMASERPQYRKQMWGLFGVSRETLPE